MFTTTWCGMRRLKRFSTGRPSRTARVNIEEDEESAAYVMSVNGGNSTVPTLQFPDGTALTNPSPPK